MKPHSPMFAPALASLLAAGALSLGFAAGAASTDTTVQAAVKGQVGGTTSAQTQSSTAESSPLTGASTERVTFSGNAVIKANVRDDPDFRTPPIVVLSIDMSGVTGVGATTRKKYVTTNQTIVQRRLRPTDTVDVSFPFWVSGTSDTGSGPSGKLSIALTYDVNTKVLTSAVGSVTNQ
jgi:hypothetical protein